MASPFLNKSSAVKNALQSNNALQLIVDAYGRAQDRLVNILLNADSTTFAKFRAAELLKQTEQIVGSLDVVAARTIGPLLQDIYKSSGRATAEAVTSAVGKINFGSGIHKNAINVLAAQMANDLNVINNGMRTSAERFIRITQQKLISDSRVSQVIGEGLVEGVTRRTISDRLYNEFRSQLGSNQFVTINGRNYDAAKYAELVARTRTREASAQASVNAAVDLGMDLVQIDVHGDACELCQTRMGRVYSISGKSKDFPQLDIAPPFHPNCKCNIFAVTEEALEFDGQKAALSKLSKETPQFVKERDAAAWLIQNKEGGIISLQDLNKYIDKVPDISLPPVTIPASLPLPPPTPAPVLSKPIDPVKVPTTQPIFNPTGNSRVLDFNKVADFNKDAKATFDFTKPASAKIDALRQYTGSTYTEINNFNRTGDKNELIMITPQKLNQINKDLDEVIESSRTKESIVVHRGSTAKLEDMFPQMKGLTDAQLLGMRVSDKTFMSTTASKTVAKQFSTNTRFVIEVPEGHAALPINLAYKSRYASEMEILLPRNSKFEITGMRRLRTAKGDIVREVTMRMVSHGK